MEPETPAASRKNAKLDFGGILLDQHLVTEEVLAQAEELNVKEGSPSPRRLAHILVDQFKGDGDKLFQELAKFYAFRIIDATQFPINEERVAFIRGVMDAFPQSLKDRISESKVLPFALDPGKDNKLLLASPDPTRKAVYEIGKSTPYKSFEPCFIAPSLWQELWRKVAVTRPSSQSSAGELGAMQEADDEEDGLFERELEEEISRSGLIGMIENVLVDGVRMGASDIHVIPKGDRITEFHFRIDGKLTLWLRFTDARTEAIAAVLKDRGKGLDRFERNMAQDGFAQMTIDGKTIRFRVSVLPTVGKELKTKFESIVIRILQEPNFSIRIEDLGFDPYSERCLRKALAKPHGIIIITGPTGSGKSTTLVAALRAIIDPSMNILTVEDPVEYFIDGARQIKLNSKLDFEGALRAILRHDPDVVMVGEMRDKTTAEIAIKLANTGHLTFSTLHTNDAISVVSRLMKMGVESFLLANAINLVVAQRLVRKLCTKCRVPLPHSEHELLRTLGMTPEEIRGAYLYAPKGCPDCINGYRGRRAIHEALYFSRAIRKAILRAEHMIDEDQIREQALSQGMVTLRQTALELLKKGITSVEEVITVTSEED